MDLRTYYQKIRDTEATLPTYILIVSRETGDGGKGGVASEVTRRVAAKMLVEGTADLATADEKAAFAERQALALRTAKDAAAAGRVELTVLSSDDLKRLRGGSKSARD